MKPANYPGGGYYVPENHKVVIDDSTVVGPTRIYGGEVYNDLGERVGVRIGYTPNGQEISFVVITPLTADEFLLGVKLNPIP